jgi:uncharacterized protein
MKHKIDDIAGETTLRPKIKRSRMGVVRMGRYHILRILRLRATPHAVALGVAAGIAAAFLPLIGVHIAVSVGLAWLLGGNMISAAAATVLVGNPLTYPIIWAATWEAGQLILGHGNRAYTRFNLHDLFAKMDWASIWRPILKPMLVGFVPLSILCSAIGYVVVYQAVKIFRARRQARLAAR